MANKKTGKPSRATPPARRPKRTTQSKPKAGGGAESLPPRPERRGPRPLGLHLASLGLAWSSLRGALPQIAGENFPWPSSLAADAARLRAAGAVPDLRARPTEDFVAAIDGAGERRMLAFAAGVTAYRDHPYRRTLTEPPTIWRQGTTRLLDYGAAAPRRASRGPALLVVPSLVNRGYVLDLTAETSLLRHLARAGHRPLLLDWGAPGMDELRFDLTDYIARRLAAALDAAVAASGGPVIALGYCMGGNLALALAQLRPREIAGLALLATPWDFHAEGPIRAPLDAASIAALSAAFDALPALPVDLLQAMFASLDPFLVSRKYRAFATQMARADARTETFVALEDWANDGVPLAARVARECLVGWYGQNAPARGLWQIDGETIVPERLAQPTLLIMPQQDRIVPPASSAALAEALPQATALRVPSGHVAMVVGRQAPDLTWRPLLRWLAEFDDTKRVPRVVKRSSPRR